MSYLLIFVGVFLTLVGVFWSAFTPKEIRPAQRATSNPYQPAIDAIEGKNQLFEHNHKLEPYSIVCANGRFNWVTEGGYVWPLHDFESLDDAIKKRDEMKAFDERNKQEARQWTPEERRAADEVAGRRWDICPENAQPPKSSDSTTPSDSVIP